MRRSAALLTLLTVVAASRLGELTRSEYGDVFTVEGGDCGRAQCADHGARAGDDCSCVCPQRAPLFREDRELCVDDLPECALASFGSGSAVARIPFVYLPLKGQIIHPSREIIFENVKTPICAVSGAQFLTRKGFLDLRNTIDSDVPFGLFRDEGRTFLQWTGEDEVRASMSGRVMVVRLLCRDVSAPSSPRDLRGVFTPCVAFRVQGTPPKQASNVTEVIFTPNAQIAQESTSSKLSVTEYVAIGVSSLLLGLIYVASVFLYLHIRKRRKAASEEGEIRKFKGLKKKDGSIITDRDIVRINNERTQTLPPMGQTDGVVKKNPLLSMGRDFQDNKNNFQSDSGSNMSDSEDFADSSGRSDDTMFHNQTTSAIIHFQNSMAHQENEMSHRDESGIERLPDEDVSIVETTDDREIARPVGTTRRKLYFNPAYFEPHLMAEPPQAAIEFLTKIREVISIAKHKMAAKRFQPVLNQIPEEESYSSTRNSVELYQGSQRSGSVISLKRENSRKKSCVGCPGCKSDSSTDTPNIKKLDIPSCINCKNKGDKQNSIRKWLENIPTGKQSLFYNEFGSNQNQSSLVNSLQSLPIQNRSIKKQHSFTSTHAMYVSDTFSSPKKDASMSVRSEPGLRSYNLPLPEFNENPLTLHNNFCPTVSRVDDIRPIGLGKACSGSLRNVHIENQRKNKCITNKNSLPDMVNEAIALEHCSKNYNQSSSDDEIINKQANAAKHTMLNRNSNSPVYNDYETDSLERISNKKGKQTPTDYEIPSSQASPSLSNALPLEEELTMRNAVYKTHSSGTSKTPSPQRELELNHYETIGNAKKPILKTSQSVKTASPQFTKKTDYSLVSEVYVNNSYDFDSAPSSPSGSESAMGTRKFVKAYDATIAEKPGCLTIEVKDPPENYIKIHESDGFEPDTLDRKHPKHKEIIENIQFSRRDLLNNINTEVTPIKRIQLRSSGTFIKTNDKVAYTAKFSSLRHDHEQKNTFERPKISPSTFEESKVAERGKDDIWENNAEWETEDGRILTLELRHSKRQRQCTPPTLKQTSSLPRPDILPPLPPTEVVSIYEQPAFPPRRVSTDRLNTNMTPKNLSGRSLSPRISMDNTTTEPGLFQNPTCYPAQCGPSCSPMRASVQSKSSGYENIDPIQHDYRKFGGLSRNHSKTSNRSNPEINTNTFVKGRKEENHSKRFRRKKGANIEDSGYLSSDSTSSRQVQRKVVIAKIVSCSDSDDTENEARSESGAESVETHSVYFGKYRLQNNTENTPTSYKSVKDCNKNMYNRC